MATEKSKKISRVMIKNIDNGKKLRNYKKNIKKFHMKRNIKI